MKNKIMIFGLIMLVSASAFFTSCHSEPQPTVNQTVVHIERVRTTFQGGTMEVYIDNRQAQDYRGKDIELKRGQSVAIPVNNGEHLIYIKMGNTRSETLRIVANGQTINLYAHQKNMYVPIVGAGVKLSFTPEDIDD